MLDVISCMQVSASASPSKRYEKEGVRDDCERLTKVVNEFRRHGMGTSWEEAQNTDRSRSLE